MSAGYQISMPLRGGHGRAIDRPWPRGRLDRLGFQRPSRRAMGATAAKDEATCEAAAITLSPAPSQAGPHPSERRPSGCRTR